MDSCVTQTKKVHMSYTWTIEDVLSLRCNYCKSYESTRFPSTSGQPAYWKLSLYPGGTPIADDCLGNIFTLYETFCDQSKCSTLVNLFLDLESCEGSDVHAKWTLRLEDSNGKAIGKPHSAVKTFDTKPRLFEDHCPNSRAKLFSAPKDALEKALEMSKDGALTIHCDITIYFDSFNVPGTGSQSNVKTE